MNDDTEARYGPVTRTLHWLMAGLIFWQLLKFGDRIAEGEHWVGQTLVPWHVSIGTLVLALALIRIVWVLAGPESRPAHDRSTAFLVRSGHFLLYAFMLLMPVTGILTMLGGGYGLTAFGIEIFAEGEKVAWAAGLGSLHAPLAWTFAALIAGHVGMALIHHVVHRDDTLRRIA